MTDKSLIELKRGVHYIFHSVSYTLRNFNGFSLWTNFQVLVAILSSFY